MVFNGLRDRLVLVMTKGRQVLGISGDTIILSPYRQHGKAFSNGFMLGKLYFALSILEPFGIAVKAGGVWEIQPPPSRITHRAAYLASGTRLQKIPRLASLSCKTGNWTFNQPTSPYYPHAWDRQAIKPAYHRQSPGPILSFLYFPFPVPFLLSAAPINPASEVLYQHVQRDDLLLYE
ncbi:uncharacterized protein CLUP02_00827 [Colletotrichum lupini]|uniref:Uncharacterized protein n=1 Tax=Colletotrichum lupini TaxID=145971 RepID=A0A9Q8SB68_9PEZI|nr:uncharacterized protein CLUP02_00827 [Colletotrichum lupini]UQC74179.1 hypothetical protein CLUP02_00827 [Colletotrichum lupini]